MSDAGNRSRPVGIEDIRHIKEVSHLLGGVPHPVAVQISPAATEVVVTKLLPGDVAVHIVEIAVAVLVEGLELGIVEGILADAFDVGAIGRPRILPSKIRCRKATIR